MDCIGGHHSNTREHHRTNSVSDAVGRVLVCQPGARRLVVAVGIHSDDVGFALAGLPAMVDANAAR